MKAKAVRAVNELPNDELRDAIQAAWIADPDLAADLALQHDLYDVVCLRCAADWISRATMPMDRPYWYYQLCNGCVWTICRGAR